MVARKPAADRYSRDLVDIVKFFLTAFIVVQVLVWLAILLKLAGITNWPVVETDKILFLFTFSIALMCAMLWVSHHLKLISLSKQTEARIWKALISAMLVAVVGAVGRVLGRW